MATTRYPSGYGSRSVVAAYVNDDGHLDLIAAGSMGSSVTVLINNGDGTFAPPTFFVAGVGSESVVIGDFDRDGRADFITFDQTPEVASPAFVAGRGDGTFEAPRAMLTPGSVLPNYSPGLDVTGGVVAEMNGDRHSDVVIIQKQQTDGSSSPFNLGVMLNDGSGKLSHPILTVTDKREWTGFPTFASQSGDLVGAARYSRERPHERPMCRAACGPGRSGKQKKKVPIPESTRTQAPRRSSAINRMAPPLCRQLHVATLANGIPTSTASSFRRGCIARAQGRFFLRGRRSQASPHNVCRSPDREPCCPWSRYVHL